MNEDPGEYTAFVAELQHAAGLLTKGGIAEERMALAIVDSLAERLLYHHAQRCFSAADARVGILTDPFPADQRAKILGDFRKRVQLALIDEEFFIFITPLLDELDAEIVRLAHDYRGPSYHRGDHNPALAGPLGRLYAQAVGRAFSRTMSNSFVSSRPDSVEALIREMTVDRRELARQLHGDTEKRLETVERVIEGLRKDLDEDVIGDLIEGAQHWAEHRGDVRLHQLAREEQALKNEAEDQENIDDDLKRRIVENQIAQVSRRDELRNEADIRVDLGTINSLRQRISQFATKTTIASLLQAYQQVDDLLEVLETAGEWAQYSWERSVEQAVEEARGK